MITIPIRQRWGRGFATARHCLNTGMPQHWNAGSKNCIARREAIAHRQKNWFPANGFDPSNCQSCVTRHQTLDTTHWIPLTGYYASRSAYSESASEPSRVSVVWQLDSIRLNIDSSAIRSELFDLQIARCGVIASGVCQNACCSNYRASEFQSRANYCWTNVVRMCVGIEEFLKRLVPRKIKDADGRRAITCYNTLPIIGRLHGPHTMISLRF